MAIDYTGTLAKPRLELGAAVMEFVEQEDEFIGTKALPIFGTRKQKAVFPAITRASITRNADTKRAARGDYNRDGFEAKDKEYSCVEYGLEGALDDTERALYQTEFNAELTTVKTITRRLQQAQEKRVANLLFNTSTFAGSSLYTNYDSTPWDDITTDVIAQVRAAKEKVRRNCGMMPNTLIMSTTNMDRLKANSAIIDRIKYTARPTDAEVTRALADLLGIKNILEGKAVHNTKLEGSSGFEGADIWSDDYAMVAVIADGQDLSLPGIGRTFLWQEDSPDNAVVEQYREEKKRCDVFRVRHYVDENIIDPYFGHLMKVDA